MTKLVHVLFVNICIEIYHGKAMDSACALTSSQCMCSLQDIQVKDFDPLFGCLDCICEANCTALSVKNLARTNMDISIIAMRHGGNNFFFPSACTLALSLSHKNSSRLSRCGFLLHDTLCDSSCSHGHRNSNWHHFEWVEDILPSSCMLTS